MSESATIQRLTYTRKEAAVAIGVGTTSFDALIRRQNDPLPHVRVGHKIVVPVDALKAWIERQATKTTAGEEE